MTVMALKKNNMERKSKNGGFKLKGHALPGIKQRASAKMADGRAKSSAFQKDEEFPGLLPEVKVEGKEELVDKLARKAQPGGFIGKRKGEKRTNNEQSIRSLGYKTADESLSKYGSEAQKKAANQRIKNRNINVAKAKAAKKKNPNITRKELNRILSGN